MEQMVKMTRNRLNNEAAEENLMKKWEDWKWQVQHCIKDVETVEEILNIRFKENKRKDIEKTIEKFPISITPYYLSLIDTEDYENDPIFKQAFPDERELIIKKSDMIDPLSEDKDSPVEGITHRYPDRVLIHVSNVCAMYCRHCTRKRKVGDVDCSPSKETIKKGLEYIRNTPAVRDVLLSGGDPFMLSDEYLDWLLGELRKIPHVEVIRIGTRTPVVLPYRITNSLVDVLRKHGTIWINTHFNHPREITKSSKEALRKLALGGIPLGNQTVLLSDVNDCPRIIKKLVHKLVHNRVRPYYLYQCDLSEGLEHFRTPIGKGIEIMESLIGHTSGFAIPTYVIDAPGGGGKIPVMPNYLISRSTNKAVLRNYEGVITTYKEPDKYNHIVCDLECDNCELHLNLDDPEETKAVGIAKLLSDTDKAITLTPKNLERMKKGVRMSDPVIKYGDSVIQHGKENDRVYLMKLSTNDMSHILQHIDQLAAVHDYTKSFAKIPCAARDCFIDNGYVQEVCIPKFFNNKEDGCLMGKFYKQKREIEQHPDKAQQVVRVALKKKEACNKQLSTAYSVKKMTEEDVVQMAELYGEVFATYPFPIHQTDYLLKTMRSNVVYFGVRHGEKLVAISSAELYENQSNAEMTDFATLPSYRGQGLALCLLGKMEEELKRRSIHMAYTIARAYSFGMNITFAKAGYNYAGALTNNTNIGGQIESMNVWYKTIAT